MSQKTDLESFGIAMSMWYRFNEAYKTRPIRYQKLLEQKIALKILPLRKIKDTDLRAYPDIPFLKTATEDEAENFLLNCTSLQISIIIHSIEMLSINYTFNTMGTFIKDAEYLISSHGKRRC